MSQQHEDNPGQGHGEDNPANQSHPTGYSAGLVKAITEALSGYGQHEAHEGHGPDNNSIPGGLMGWNQKRTGDLHQTVDVGHVTTLQHIMQRHLSNAATIDHLGDLAGLSRAGLNFDSQQNTPAVQNIGMGAIISAIASGVQHHEETNSDHQHPA